MARFSRRAFTLVELLVVIAIIGILVSLTMPAIQSSREAGRRTTCLNNVRNLGVAVQQVVTNHGQYPTGGWGHGWWGDPDRGYDRRQPGGWAYTLLAYIEETNLRKLGISDDPKTFTQAKKDASRVRAQTVLPILLCPTRGRTMGLNWYNDPAKGDMVNMVTNGLPEVAKTDYAINGGSDGPGVGSSALNYNYGPGIGTLAVADTSVDASFTAAQLGCDGVSHIRSMIKPAHVFDGASKTYLIGEKYINFFTTGPIDSGSDNQSWEIGFDWDTYRFGEVAPDFDSNPNAVANNTNFGSAHLAGFNMVMCDGSTRQINYDIDLATHTALSGRKDGGPKESLP